MLPSSLYRPAAAGLLMWLLIILPVTLSLSCRQQPQVEKSVQPTPQATVAKNPLEMPTPVVGQPYPGTGVVTIINLKEGWVEINHEEIKGLMPAMQMEWSVKNRSLLKSIRVGDKVDFTVVETGRGEIITQLKRVTPTR